MTGADSFFALTDAQARDAIRQLNHENNGKKEKSNLTGEVARLYEILIGICNDEKTVNSELKKLTGVDSFNKLDEKQAGKAIEQLTESVLGEY